MKRFAIGMFIALAMVVIVAIGTDAFAKDYDVFTYEITSVDGDEINGIALDNKSSDNMGIYLLQSETAPILQVGDVIKVSFEKDVHDNILDVERVID